MSDQIDENKFYCEKQKQYVDRCPAPRLAMPVKKCEPPIYDEYPTEELLYAEDIPEPEITFDPRFDISCKHTGCQEYQNMVKRIIEIHKDNNTRKF